MAEEQKPHDSHQWIEAEKRCSCGWTDGIHGMSHLHIEEPAFADIPHIWIQWKGTDVCCDIWCDCGASMHYDGDFMYFLKCSGCGAVWEVGTHVPLYRVRDNRADGAIIKEPED